MKTVMICNEKGGVGKTTLTHHLAAGMACRRKRVLVVDADPQGHATKRFGLAKAPGIYDLLVRSANWAEVARRVPGERFGMPGEPMPRGQVIVLPSNVETRNIASSISEADLFSQRIAELENRVDLVVIDSSPTPSLLHGILYMASDAVIYPTELTYDSFDGLVEAITHRQEADKARASRWGMKPIDLMGIVPVKYRASTLEQSGNLAKLRESYNGNVWEPVAISTTWTEVERVKVPVWGIDPASAAARDAWRLVDIFEERLYGTAV
jgi:chromosome partitioning protein